MRGRLPRAIVVPEFAPSTIPVTITGSGNSNYCYATIGGTKVYSAGNYEVLPGDTITFGVYGYNTTYYGRVRIDGNTALNVTSRNTQTYNWTVPSGVTSIKIEMSYNSTSSQRYGRMDVITTSGGGNSGGGGGSSNKATITVTDSGGNYCYLTMPDGTKVTSAGTYEIDIGSIIQCYCTSLVGSGTVILNGNTVVSASPASYSYTVTKNATIKLYQQNTTGYGSAKITITEG